MRQSGRCWAGGPIDLLKIDAEGAGAAILRGGMDTLPHVARIQVEYHTESLRQEVVALLHAAGFAVVHDVPQINDIGILYACRRTDRAVRRNVRDDDA